MARTRPATPKRLALPLVPSPIRVRMPKSADEPAADFMQELYRTTYEAHGFKMGALQAVVDCHRRSLSVPPWLLRYLADGIAKHIGPAGASLDQAIGLVGREGRRRGDGDFFRWNSQAHAVGLVHRTRSEDNPETGSKYGVRGACRALVAAGMSAGLSARSLEATYRKRRREFT